MLCLMVRHMRHRNRETPDSIAYVRAAFIVGAHSFLRFLPALFRVFSLLLPLLL